MDARKNNVKLISQVSLFAICLLSVALSLPGCNQQNEDISESVITHTVRFFVDGDVIDAKTAVPDGSKIEPPQEGLLKGYEVSFWRAGEEEGLSRIWSFSDDVVVEDLDLYADFEYGTYSATLIDDKFALPYATKKVVYKQDYDFSGVFEDNHYHVSKWRDERGNSLQLVGKWSIPGSATLHAVWEATNYKISYDLNGGERNDPSNPTDYSAESGQIELKPATRSGYRFIGWMYNQEYIDAVDGSFYGDLVLTAAWDELYALSVASDDPQNGSVSIAKGSSSNAAGDVIEVKAAYAWGCAFKGWYRGDELVSCDDLYSFVMPAEDCALTAKFWTREETIKSWGLNPILDSADNTLTYGLYPQTHVTNKIIIDALELLTHKENNGWYLLNGDYYAKATATYAASQQSNVGKREFEDGEEIIVGTTYWFKCEPVRWKVLSTEENEYLLLSSILLDARRYYSTSSSKTASFASNYMNSEIRGWLNGDFYNSIFRLNDSCVQTVVVDNSAATTYSSSNAYACSDTEDKMYFLSYQDYLNTAFGFTTERQWDDLRKCRTSDWARANGAYGRYLSYDAEYWTRSPCPADSSKMETVSGISGSLVRAFKINVGEKCGVRPAITIEMPQ